MYAIGYIVYGVDLQHNPYNGAPDPYESFRDEIADLIEQEVVESRYSGGGIAPEFFGVEMGEIDECNSIRGDDLMSMLKPTDDHKLKFQQKLDALEDVASPELFEAIRKDVPEVFLTWGSS